MWSQSSPHSRSAPRRRGGLARRPDGRPPFEPLHAEARQLGRVLRRRQAAVHGELFLSRAHGDGRGRDPDAGLGRRRGVDRREHGARGDRRRVVPGRHHERPPSSRQRPATPRAHTASPSSRECARSARSSPRAGGSSPRRPRRCSSTLGSIPCKRGRPRRPSPTSTATASSTSWRPTSRTPTPIFPSSSATATARSAARPPPPTSSCRPTVRSRWSPSIPITAASCSPTWRS